MKGFYLFFSVFLTPFYFAQTLKVNIHSVRKAEGSIRLVFYTDSKSFDDEKSFLIKKVSKRTLVNGSLSVSYNGLKPGIYGIAILDDENENEKMDYGLVMPKEGFGFSNYYHTGMTRPKFESFDFVLDKKDLTVEIKLRYL